MNDSLEYDEASNSRSGYASLWRTATGTSRVAVGALHSGRTEDVSGLRSQASMA